MTTTVPSRWQIGDRCLFQPNLNKIDFSTGKSLDPYSAIEAHVCGVTMRGGKVRYHIEILFREPDGEMWLPIDGVDSLMMCPLED